MPSPTKPVEDTIGKVNDDISVGSDLGFQRRWWRFERIVWIAFVLLVLADILGFLGRGHFAKGETHTNDGQMDVRYERIERTATPSVLAVQFAPSAIHDGKVRLWASENLVRELGAQRVIPEPLSSVIGDGGILYTFSANVTPASVAFALEPRGPGMCHLSLGIPGSELATLNVFVMP